MDFLLFNVCLALPKKGLEQTKNKTLCPQYNKIDKVDQVSPMLHKRCVSVSVVECINDQVDQVDQVHQVDQVDQVDHMDQVDQHCSVTFM